MKVYLALIPTVCSVDTAILFQPGLFTNSRDGQLLVDLTYGYEYDQIYVVAVIKKDTRSAFIVQSIEITRGAPPSINPDLCISNCGVSRCIEPSNQVGCIECAEWYDCAGCSRCSRCGSMVMS